MIDICYHSVIFSSREKVEYDIIWMEKAENKLKRFWPRAHCSWVTRNFHNYCIFYKFIKSRKIKTLILYITIRQNAPHNLHLKNEFKNVNKNLINLFFRFEKVWGRSIIAFLSLIMVTFIGINNISFFVGKTTFFLNLCVHYRLFHSWKIESIYP